MKKKRKQELGIGVRRVVRAVSESVRQINEPSGGGGVPERFDTGAALSDSFQWQTWFGTILSNA